MAFKKVGDEIEGEDTEGNRIKLIRMSEDEGDGDDTEGHRIKLIR